MTYAYIRQVPNLDDLVSQKQHILSFAYQKGIEIDKEVLEYATKNLRIDEREDFERFLKSLDEGHFTVLVSSLAILSSRVEELVKIIGCILSHDVDLWICETGTLINKASGMVEVFSLLEEQRIQPTEKTSQIGRPKGSKSSSKFDVYHAKIVELLSVKESVSAIARELGVSRSSLKDYIESRGLKELVNNIDLSTQEMEEAGMDNVVMICPFEREEQQRMYREGV